MTNVDKLRRAYQMWFETRGKSTAVWLEMLAPDVVLQSLASGDPAMKFSATRRGRIEAEQYFAELAEQWEMLEFHAEEFIAERDRVVMLGRCAWRFRATGKTVESPIAHIWRFHNGQAIEFFEFYDTARAFAAAVPD
ncbi:MAG: nuclear transport factor 2 family protein [Isosphaeraceae bacterium]|nr:nuclear transport factor 2 family protein [Isosphaeraceae bacterium]